MSMNGADLFLDPPTPVRVCVHDETIECEHCGRAFTREQWLAMRGICTCLVAEANGIQATTLDHLLLCRHYDQLKAAALAVCKCYSDGKEKSVEYDELVMELARAATA